MCDFMIRESSFKKKNKSTNQWLTGMPWYPGSPFGPGAPGDPGQPGLPFSPFSPSSPGSPGGPMGPGSPNGRDKSHTFRLEGDIMDDFGGVIKASQLSWTIYNSSTSKSMSCREIKAVLEGRVELKARKNVNRYNALSFQNAVWGNGVQEYLGCHYYNLSQGWKRSLECCIGLK